MSKTKLKPWKRSLIAEYLVCEQAPEASIGLIDNSPKLLDAKHREVAQVAYLLHPDHTFSVWMLYPEPEDGERDETRPYGLWKCEKKNIVPGRVEAHAHWDQLKWQLFRKSDTERRKEVATPDTVPDREQIRHCVRYLYDLQKLRIQFGNRDTDQAAPAVLDDDDKTFLGRQSLGLGMLEKSALAELEHMLKKVPIYTWLKAQKGIGPTLAGVMIAEIDITRCETPSALWAYAGLAVNPATGKAVKRQRGVKSNWNPFLKAKLVFVMGGCLLKCNSPWREFYDNYRHRKQNQMVKVCMLCDGTGVVDSTTTPSASDEATTAPEEVSAETEPKKTKQITCYNCDGKKHNVPWGRGDAHRHQAAVRYMVKQFLLELWKEWRGMEGLEIVAPYSEAKLGMKHGDHANIPQDRKSKGDSSDDE